MFTGLMIKKAFISAQLLLIGIAAFPQEATIDTAGIYSPSMNKIIKAVIVKPGSYENKGKKYPVVYLLHGHGGAYKDWVTKVPSIKYYASLFNIILVCPNGENSWYINSPVSNSSQFESFVGTELIRFIDSSYNTIADNKHRAIAGLSMGGHGALMLGIRNKDKFGAAGSMSGALDLEPLIKKYDLTKLIGDTAVNHFNWRNYSVLQLADSNSTKGIKLIFDCGVKDFLIQSNRDLHQKLNAQNIPHDYIERPGGHSWPYWTNAISYQLLFFRKFFDETDMKL